MPTLSIICPIFNGIDFLPVFFHSLIDALPEGAQLILVDDGSTQQVFETVPRSIKQAKSCAFGMIEIWDTQLP
jgi:hypothetical protein